MIISYEMPVLRMKLNSADPIEAPRAIYTLLRHIDALEEKVLELEKEVRELQSKGAGKA